MKYTTETLPIVEPIMLRKIIPTSEINFDGGYMLLTECSCENIGLADSRLSHDEDIIDTSNGVFRITTSLMMCENPVSLMIFSSRRFRNFREGNEITGIPSEKEPLIFIGNPIKLFVKNGEITVTREKSYIIKSGCELMSMME